MPPPRLHDRDATLCVGGVTYTVVMTDRLIDLADGGKALATNDLDRSIIRISRVAAPTKRWKTLLHELGHAIVEEHDHADATAFDEETLCNLIAAGLVEMTGADFDRLKAFVMAPHPAPQPPEAAKKSSTTSAQPKRKSPSKIAVKRRPASERRRGFRA